MIHKHTGKFEFRPDYTVFYIFLIALAIFILGVQVGIKQGRKLQLEDIYEQVEYVVEQAVEYGNNSTD